MNQKQIHIPFRRLSLVAAAMLPMFGLATGCKRGDSADDSPAAVRMIDAVQGGDALQARIDGAAIPGKLLPQSDTDFVGAQPGSYSVAIGSAAQGGGFSPLASTQVNVTDGRRYTAIAYGATDASAPVHLQIFSAPKLTKAQRDQAAQSGKAMVAVFNAAPGSAKLDLLVNSIVAFKGVAYGHRSAFIPLAALPYEWSAVPAGSGPDQMLGQATTLQLNSGRVYLVLVEGDAAASGIHMEAFEQ